MHQQSVSKSVVVYADKKDSADILTLFIRVKNGQERRPLKHGISGYLFGKPNYQQKKVSILSNMPINYKIHQNIKLIIELRAFL